MKILQVHNYYREPGGEDRVFDLEYKLLTRKGHQVHRLTRTNDSIGGAKDKLRLLFQTHYSRSSYREMKRELKRIQPELVHVHNFFPLFTPSIFDATADMDVPAVLTLHNYRLIHPNAKMTAGGRIDERSLRDSAYSCVWDGVYRNSRVQTAVVAHMIEYHRKEDTWDDKVDQFIALNEFSRQKFEEGGLPPEKLTVKPNFIPDFREDRGSSKDPSFYVYVGRISREKGVETLIRAWMEGEIQEPLYIIGEGPRRKALVRQSAEADAINWTGYLGREKVQRYLEGAKALIFPSEWYECFPMVILEAFCSGTGVISSDIGSQRSIVNDGQNGLHFSMSDSADLARKVRIMEKNSTLIRELGRHARQTYEKRYTPEQNYRELIQIYRSLIDKSE